MTETEPLKHASDTYGLTRNAKESQRLDGQHFVWKKNLGFLLHPSVIASIPQDARIGDVGTGTGVWLIDLANESKDTNRFYEGFDVSPSQFPLSSPEGMSFSVLNILEPIPQSMIGTFDVVHLRLLILGLPRDTWELACTNVLRLLKPGGWLQWEEGDFASMRVLQSKVGTSRHSAEHLLDMIIGEGMKRGQGYHDVPKLATMVANAGFNNLHVDVFGSDRDSELREAFTNTVLGATRGIIEMFSKMDGGEGYWGSDAATSMHQDAVSELEDGKAYYRVDITVICAQKPQIDSQMREQ